VSIARVLFIVGVFLSGFLSVAFVNALWKTLRRYYRAPEYRRVGSEEDDESASLLHDDGDVSDIEEAAPAPAAGGAASGAMATVSSMPGRARALLLHPSLVQFSEDVAAETSSDRLLHGSLYAALVACTCLVLSVAMFASWNLRNLRFDFSVGYYVAASCAVSEAMAGLLLMVQLHQRADVAGSGRGAGLGRGGLAYTGEEDADAGKGLETDDEDLHLAFAADK
jgi:hypothetical protein